MIISRETFTSSVKYYITDAVGKKGLGWMINEMKLNLVWLSNNQRLEG